MLRHPAFTWRSRSVSRSASIPIAVISVAFFRRFGSTILENNMVPDDRLGR